VSFEYCSNTFVCQDGAELFPPFINLFSSFTIDEASRFRNYEFRRMDVPTLSKRCTGMNFISQVTPADTRRL
jgi:hypothetical protein